MRIYEFGNHSCPRIDAMWKGKEGLIRGEGYQGSICQRIQLVSHYRRIWEPPLVLTEPLERRPD